MLRLFPLFVFVMFVLACGVCESGKPISEKQYGKNAWPLTVKEATLQCNTVQGVPGAKMVWVESEGYSYPVNGTAKSTLQSQMPWLKIRSIDRIWRSDPANPGYRVSIGPLISNGLKVC